MVLLMVLPVCALVLSPVVEELFDAIQEKVELLLAVKPKFNAFPLQTEAELALVTVGVGLTVKVTD